MNAADLAEVKRRLNTSASDATAAGGSYGVFADVNADGRINAVDIALVKRHLNTRLPGGESVPLAPGEAAPGPTVTKDFFSPVPVFA